MNTGVDSFLILRIISGIIATPVTNTLSLRGSQISPLDTSATSSPTGDRPGERWLRWKLDALINGKWLKVDGYVHPTKGKFGSFVMINTSYNFALTLEEEIKPSDLDYKNQRRNRDEHAKVFRLPKRGSGCVVRQWGFSVIGNVSWLRRRPEKLGIRSSLWISWSFLALVRAFSVLSYLHTEHPPSFLNCAGSQKMPGDLLWGREVEGLQQHWHIWEIVEKRNDYRECGITASSHLLKMVLFSQDCSFSVTVVLQQF